MAKRKLGGYKQQLAQEKETQQPPASKLADQLLQKWSWGTMSGPTVQQLAVAACEDGLTQPDLVKLSEIGVVATIREYPPGSDPDSWPSKSGPSHH